MSRVYAMGLLAFSDEVLAAVAYQGSPSRLRLATPHHPLRYLHLARHLFQADFSGVNDRHELDEAFVAGQGLTPLLAGHRRSAA